MKKHPILTTSIVCLLIAIYTYISPCLELPNISFFEKYFVVFSLIGSISVFYLVGAILGKIGWILVLVIVGAAILVIFNNWIYPIPFIDNFVTNHPVFVQKFIAFPYVVIALFAGGVGTNSKDSEHFNFRK